MRRLGTTLIAKRCSVKKFAGADNFRVQDVQYVSEQPPDAGSLEYLFVNVGIVTAARLQQQLLSESSALSCTSLHRCKKQACMDSLLLPLTGWCNERATWEGKADSSCKSIRLRCLHRAFCCRSAAGDNPECTAGRADSSCGALQPAAAECQQLFLDCIFSSSKTLIPIRRM